MAKIIIKISLCLAVLGVLFIWSGNDRLLAATSTPSATPAGTTSRAQELLERVATKVATLAAKWQRFYSGKIKTIGESSLTIVTSEGDRSVSTNEATSFYRIRAGVRTEINFKALRVGDDIAAVGTVDPTTSGQTAKQVIAKIRRYNVVGEVTEVVANTLTIKEISGQTTKVDLEGAKLVKVEAKNAGSAGRLGDFSVGARVFVMAYLSDDNETLSALRALVILK